MTVFTTNKLSFFFLFFLFLTGIEVKGQCGFVANPPGGCQGFTLTLQDTTSNSTNTNWDILLPNNTHRIFANNRQAQALMSLCGTVTVTMHTTVNGSPCTKVSTVSVDCAPVIRESVSPSIICVGQNVCLTDASTSTCGPLSYSIDWRLGTQIATVPGCKQYSLASPPNNPYCPTVVVTDSCGCRSDTTFIGNNCVTVLSKPNASFTGTPLSSCASPLVSTMTAMTGTSVWIYKWYINGSNVPAQSGRSNIFTHSYVAGTYSIRLIVTDSITGCTDTLIRPSYVSAGTSAAACYTTTQPTGCVNDRIICYPCTSGGLSYVWSFPGGNPSSVTASTNTTESTQYSSPGVYSSQLIVFYAGGCIDTVTKVNYVTIGRNYILNFTSPDTFSCRLPDTVHITYTGQQCPSCTFTWTPIGNLYPHSQVGTTVILNSYQSYSPTLTVTDTLGCSSTLTKPGYILAQKLKASVLVTPLGPNSCVNDSFVVTNTTVGGPFSVVSWSFPGSVNFNRGQNEVHVKYPTPGCHKYRLVVQNTQGCIDSLLDSICVGIKPSVSLSVTPHDVCYEQICNNFQVLLNLGSDTPTTVTIWPEGLLQNITTVITDTPGRPISLCYFYQDIGTFLPCFVAKQNGCIGDTICMNAVTDTIHILAPAAQFQTIASCSNPFRVTYINQSKLADSTFWVIDGVTYPDQDTITILYTGVCGQKHAVSLTAVNFSTHCVHTKRDSTLIPCLGVDFVTDSSRKSCYFDLSTINDFRIIYTDTSATHPSQVVWDFSAQNGGPNFNPPAPTGDSVNNLLRGTGSYTVCAQLTYAGCIDTLCKPDYLMRSRPTASFNVSDTVGCTPFLVNFANTSTFVNAPKSNFYWNFGDSVIVDSTVYSPSHIYDSSSVYIATLTVVDTNGCTSTSTKQLVANRVKANFWMSDSSTCTANPDTLNPITFASLSTGFVAHYQWILPAALGPTNPNPGDTAMFSSRFNQTGTGDVCLIAIDKYGICHDTICKTIHVVNPIADYTLPNLSDTFHICPPAVINPFIDLSHDSAQNNVCLCLWNFGDGSPIDTNCNSPHIYRVPGDYVVTHTIISCHGCVDSSQKYRIHIKGPTVSFHSDKLGGCPCTVVSYFVSSYNADELSILSGGGAPLFVNVNIPRGTRANPTLDTFTFTYCNAGDVEASITAVDNADSSCRVFFPSLDTVVIDTPSVGFAYRLGSCGSDSVCFRDTTHYTASHAHTLSRIWDFGDGSPTDTSAAPCHHFPAPGNYTVSLQVTDNVGCVKTLSENVHVPKVPIAMFGVDDTIGCVQLILHFTDSVAIVDDSTHLVSGSWNFGDGFVANTYADTSHIYMAANIPPAKYTVTFVIVDGYGCTDTAKRQIQVNPPTQINIGQTQIICLGDTATLSGSGSPTLHWSPAYNIDTTNLSAPRVWPRVDTTYLLRAGNYPRCYIYDSVRINVSTLTASDSANILCRGQATILTSVAHTTHAAVTSYLWSFGDGTYGQGQYVNHVYPTYGNFTDSLIVVNSVGCRDTVINSVTIIDKPHAMMIVSDSIICLGATITADNVSTPGVNGGLDGFTWDMQPDGNPDFTTSHIAYTYPQAGGYIIYLMQGDVNQCRDTAKQRITVHSIPKAIFTADSNCVLLMNTFRGYDIIGDADITHYHWSINGVAQTASDSSVIHRAFVSPGDYNVCLSVSDTFGCQSPDSCGLVNIVSQPLDTVGPKDTTICLGYSAAFNITGRYSTIQWVPAIWIDHPDRPNVVITPRQDIQYLVYGYYGQCHPKIDTVTIWVIDSVPIVAAANPTNIVLGMSSNVTSTVKGIIDSIVWDPDTTLSCSHCRNPIATPKQTTTYTATIYYSKNGVTCSNKASVTITVFTSCDNSLIYVPNTFTPNNDNTNDVFRIRGQGISRVNYFRVFDRWGKLVYEANNVENPDDAAWNGALNNDKSKPENGGVFVYLFEIQCITGQAVTGKGNVTLIR